VSSCPVQTGSPGNVIDGFLGIKLGALAARPVEDIDNMRFQLGEAKLKHREEADRPRANNNDIGGSAVRRHRFFRLVAYASSRHANLVDSIPLGRPRNRKEAKSFLGEKISRIFLRNCP